MYLQARSIFKKYSALIVSIVFLSCASGEGVITKQSTSIKTESSLLLVPGQLSAPQSIKSVQLYRRGFEGNLPIIELGSGQKLVLEFDELASVSGQYRISFSHHNKNWQESGLPDPWIFDGINELFVRGGTPNQLYKPDYFHYKSEFPNRDLNFTVSGHYMLHVFDYQSGTELFSLPFFVTEAEGELQIRSETLFNQGEDGSAMDQLFGRYSYPEFVEFPRFDLSYTFIQNRFWRNSRNAAQISFTNDGLTEFHLSRENSFAANFEFSALNLTQLNLQNPQIFNFEPAKTPQRVTLKDDFLNFLADPKPQFNSESGLPNDEATARYTEVIFRLNTGNRLNNSDRVYLLGDFNQWTVSERDELQFNPDLNVYQTSSLIKEGRYSYKYVTLESGNINTLRLSDSLTKRDQEYIGFVYYRDPQYQYDRILNTMQLNARY